MSDEYIYEFPNTSAFMYTLRRFLESSNKNELSALLAGADCEFSSHGQFSRVRWDTYSATVIFRVSVDNLDGFTEETKQELLDIASRVMPVHSGYILQQIDITPNLVAPPTEETLNSVSVELAQLRHQFNPVFGQPTSDEAFECDVFMIMPFDEKYEPVYRRIVVPTVESLGLTIKRGDDPFSNHEIMYEIWSMLNSSRLVIADCTGRNPNVFYELGIAHTVGKPVIMLTQNIRDLPFDVQGRRAISYDTQFHRIDALKNQLSTAIRSILHIQEEELPF